MVDPLKDDLNGNGVIDDFEVRFESISESSRSVSSEEKVVEISNADEFISPSFPLDSNGDEIAKNKVIFKLMADIDLSEKQISNAIDFKGSIIYGNNKYIYFNNFASYSDSSAKAIIANASSCYDLRVYFGYIKNLASNGNNYTTFLNCENLENCSVRGGIYLTGKSANIGFLSLNSNNEIKTNISKCYVLADIVIDNSEASGTVNLGGLTDNLKGKILESSVDLEIAIFGKGKMYLGGACGISSGFIEDTVSSVNIVFKAFSEDKVAFGGLVGKLEPMGEIKNCTANLTNQGISLDRKSSISNVDAVDVKAQQVSSFSGVDGTKGCISAGGVVGECYGSIFYTIANGDLIAEKCKNVVLGGFIGSSKNSYVVFNISNTKLYSKLNKNVYIANFVGNAIGGFFNSCISNSVMDITTYVLKKESGKSFAVLINGTTTTMHYDVDNVNAGLFFFTSNYFINDGNLIETQMNFNESAGTGGEYECVENDLIESAYSPSVLNILSLGKNYITYDFSSITDEPNFETYFIESLKTENGDNDTKLNTAKNSVCEKLSHENNYGGLWWWSIFKSSSQPIKFGPTYFKDSTLINKLISGGTRDLKNILYSTSGGNTSSTWLSSWDNLVNYNYLNNPNNLGFNSGYLVKPDVTDSEFTVDKLTFANNCKGSLYNVKTWYSSGNKYFDNVVGNETVASTQTIEEVINEELQMILFSNINLNKKFVAFTLDSDNYSGFADNATFETQTTTTQEAQSGTTKVVDNYVLCEYCLVEVNGNRFNIFIRYEDDEELFENAIIRLRPAIATYYNTLNSTTYEEDDFAINKAENLSDALKSVEYEMVLALMQMRKIAFITVSNRVIVNDSIDSNIRIFSGLDINGNLIFTLNIDKSSIGENMNRLLIFISTNQSE